MFWTSIWNFLTWRLDPLVAKYNVEFKGCGLWSALRYSSGRIRLNCSCRYSLEVSSPHQEGGRRTTSHTEEHCTTASNEKFALNCTAQCKKLQHTLWTLVHTAQPSVSMENIASCMRAYSCGVCPAFIHSTNSSTLGSDALQGCNIHHSPTSFRYSCSCCC